MVLVMIPLSSLNVSAAAGDSEDNPILITSAGDFLSIDLSQIGKYYRLENDISVTIPLGDNYNQLNGNFDGSGHVITLDIHVSANEHAGLFGRIGNNGKVKNLGVKGKVDITGSASFVGGLAGENSGTIKNCYSNCNVSASVSVTPTNAIAVGGLVGRNIGNIYYCYATGDVSGKVNTTEAYVGGLVGGNIGGIITQSYYNYNATQKANDVVQNPSGVGQGGGNPSLIPSDMFAFANTLNAGAPTNMHWTSNGMNYPYLTSDYAGGSGTPTDPFLIKTAEQMKNVYKNLSSCFKLMNDINVGDITPIGTETDPFTSTFDGNSHAVTVAIVYSLADDVYAGLFGCTYNATIKNLGVKGSVKAESTTDISHAGGLAGVADGTIENCYSLCSVENITGSVIKPAYTGGLVGFSQSEITNCYATGNITTSGLYLCVGGLVGYQYPSNTITSCYATGKVTATSPDTSKVNAGGLLGGDYFASTNNCILIKKAQV